MKILQINASARADGSNSTRLADAITAKLTSAHPDAVVEVRDLARDPHPVLDEPALAALFTPADRRSPGAGAAGPARSARDRYPWPSRVRPGGPRSLAARKR